jgi:hypothetical protein
MKITTTHDPRGGGCPRLIFAMGGEAPAGTEQRQFELLRGVTVIGSGADADLRLDGLDEYTPKSGATMPMSTSTSTSEPLPGAE